MARVTTERRKLSFWQFVRRGRRADDIAPLRGTERRKSASFGGFVSLLEDTLAESGPIRRDATRRR